MATTANTHVAHFGDGSDAPKRDYLVQYYAEPEEDGYPNTEDVAEVAVDFDIETNDDVDRALAAGGWRRTSLFTDQGSNIFTCDVERI